MKKVFIGLLALIMVLGLVGCSTQPKDLMNESEKTEEANDQTSEFNSEFAKTIKIGNEIETEQFILEFSNASMEKNYQGQYYLAFDFSYKNTDTIEHDFQNDFIIQLLYDNKYNYDKNYNMSYSGLVKPLETIEGNDAIFIPEEVANTDKSLSIIVEYQGQKYQFVIQ